jgi:hypothetical protein
MPANGVFRVNGPQVIYENIDGEVVLINLEQGAYYSTDQAGADVWGLIESGRGLREIHDAIRAGYDGDEGQIEKAVSDYIAELVREELIVAAEVVETENREPEEQKAGSAINRPRFQAPVLHKYSDMKDMLLLDPIHDVEESGWPAPKAVEESGWPAPKTAD